MSATGEASDRGSTLLEAMVVLAIAGLIAGMAFPNLARGLQAGALRHATRALAGDLATARHDAIRSGSPITFAVAGDGRGYGWTGSGRRQAPPDMVLAMSPNAVTFDPEGRALAAANLTVGSAHGERRLFIDPTSGRARELPVARTDR
jgi:general secretion pathway protein H